MLTRQKRVRISKMVPNLGTIHGNSQEILRNDHESSPDWGRFMVIPEDPLRITMSRPQISGGGLGPAFFGLVQRIPVRRPACPGLQQAFWVIPKRWLMFIPR